MFVNSLLKTEEGTYHFQGELSQEEVDVVMQAGLNYLLQAGAIPFSMQDTDGLKDILEPSPEKQ